MEDGRPHLLHGQDDPLLRGAPGLLEEGVGHVDGVVDIEARGDDEGAGGVDVDGEAPEVAEADGVDEREDDTGVDEQGDLEVHEEDESEEEDCEEADGHVPRQLPLHRLGHLPPGEGRQFRRRKC